MKESIDLYRQRFSNFAANITAIDELFEVVFTPLRESGRPFSRCGLCRRYMKLGSWDAVSRAFWC
jgi:DNA topoisomerase III